jgi:hypothetical protein
MAVQTLVSIRVLDLSGEPGEECTLSSVQRERLEVLASVLDELEACGADQDRAAACADLLMHLARSGSGADEPVRTGVRVRPAAPKAGAQLPSGRRTARRYRRR